jgi:hypothetical protein
LVVTVSDLALKVAATCLRASSTRAAAIVSGMNFSTLATWMLDADNVSFHTDHDEG